MILFFVHILIDGIFFKMSEADARENGGLDEIADVRVKFPNHDFQLNLKKNYEGDIMMMTIRQKKLRLGPRSFKIFFSKLKTIWQKWTTTFSTKTPKKQLVRKFPTTFSTISTKIPRKQWAHLLSLMTP